ncbi:unnamed protein product [Chironomus riparius]|uniref:Farnesoic acid O-methyl transferase domain-containing protein n=1 Tax=Chironomus riparius TaxID=315576 RepID=A0A9N9S9M3_9DIPT|nr:unnamed protein product [Chironomus riparius]
MIQRILILISLASLALAQSPLFYCNLVIIEERCTCNFVIYNPAGFNNLTITANPAENCTLSDVVDATGSGLTLNVPSALCNQLPILEELRMDKLGVNNLVGNPFRNCNNLKKLHLSDNSLSAIPAYAFSNTILESLKLNQNKITSINSVSFDNLVHLEFLDLSNNSPLALVDDTFDHLENLKFLHMSSCGITSLHPRLFDNLGELRELDTSGNNVTTVVANLFSSLKKLEILNLANCGLTGITASAIQNNTELLKLNLENNNIKNFNAELFNGQQKLADLSLANNNNATITPQLFTPLTSMQRLILSNCNINAINGSWFVQMPNLVEIDLSKNRIPAIPENTFSSANAIESINLANNSITILSSRSFGSLHNLHSLHLENNAINQADHHLISHSTELQAAYFGNNICANFNTDEFSLNRTFYTELLKECFDNFDSIPIAITTINSTIYDWYSVRTNDGWDSLEVSVRAYENVHIALSNSINTVEPPIEIKIGEDRNRRSHILEQGEIVFTDNVRDRLNRTAERTFIIGWRFGIVMVFRKLDQLPFMAHAIENDFPVNFFGLRTLFTDDVDMTAKWNVTRIQRELQSMAMTKIYQDIEIRRKRGMPIDLQKYLRN